jgi:hypothetical protein
MRASIVEFVPTGVYCRRWRRRFSLSYGEILTAERVVSGRGLRLHTVTSQPVFLRCRGAARVAIEDELRRRGVRIVDQYGAMITPALADFENELENGPDFLRQSSDSAGG